MTIKSNAKVKGFGRRVPPSEVLPRAPRRRQEAMTAPPPPVAPPVPQVEPERAPEVAPEPVAPARQKKLSVVIAAYRAEKWIGAALDSILASHLPEHWRLEVVVAVDGCDATWETVRSLDDDPRVGVLKLAENVGTYRASNTAIAHSTGDWFARVDADDVLHPDRLRRMCDAIDRAPHLSMVNTWFRNVDPDLRVVNDINKAADGVWAWKRHVWDRLLGGFEGWDSAADSEVVFRARALGLAAHVVPAHLYLRRQHGGNLTMSPETGYGSPARARWWRILMDRNATWDAGAEPLPVRPQVGEVVERAGGLWASRVTASLASIPSRRDALADVVARLLPQVDRLNVFLNGYDDDDVPGVLDHHRVRVARSQDEGDHGDAGKFWWAGGVEGYHLTCDDDLAYPPDYVDRMVAAVDRHGGRAIVTLHGYVVHGDFEVLGPAGRTLYHFADEQGADVPVHVGGTGVMAYHAGRCPVRPVMDDFRAPNMADVWMAGLCQDADVPIVAIEHPAGWVQPIETDGEPLFRRPHPERDAEIRRRIPWRLAGA